MSNYKKKESSKLLSVMKKNGVTMDDLFKATGKRPDYIDRVTKGVYPITRPICKAVDSIANLEDGYTFDYCTKIKG